MNSTINLNPKANPNSNLNSDLGLKPDISLTPKAVEHIKTMLQAADSTRNSELVSAGIRLGVKASGCSGLSYVLDFIKEEQSGDVELDIEGIRILIDAKSISYLKGMEIDCVEEGLNKHIIFNNPNVKGKCGCGESFTVGED